VRPVVLHPKAREAIRAFPKEARFRIGQGLFLLQSGETIPFPNSRAMPSVASGVSELRVKGRDGAYRAFYYVASARGVLVFHAFAKKTQKTPMAEIEMGRKRLKEILHAQG
jgi:phage-related protein